uniref:Uncharacterized protein n=1 Tax=Arundo donax TaxID=35708 RepID=A0A0A9CGV7_ARUDO
MAPPSSFAYLAFLPQHACGPRKCAPTRIKTGPAGSRELGGGATAARARRARNKRPRPRSPLPEHACGIVLRAAPLSRFSTVASHEEAPRVDSDITRQCRTAEAAVPRSSHVARHAALQRPVAASPGHAVEHPGPRRRHVADLALGAAQ